MVAYGLLADIVMVLHAALILLVFVGIFVALEWRKFRPVEAAILASALLVWSLYGGCPLTNLENYFRIKAGAPLPVQEIGFIAFYIKQWFGFAISDAKITVATYLIAALFFLLSLEWFHLPTKRLWRTVTGRKAHDR